MDNGWQSSAQASITDQGDQGDFGRRYVLDPVLLPRALARSPQMALDIGCGEGRFCRILSAHGIAATGLDPTPVLPEAAQTRHPQGTYLEGDVLGLTLLMSPSAELARSAMGAVGQWRYPPTLLNGDPVEIQTVVDVNYTLTK